jgi:hypothetical protein
MAELRERNKISLQHGHLNFKSKEIPESRGNANVFSDTITVLHYSRPHKNSDFRDMPMMMMMIMTMGAMRLKNYLKSFINQ